jgi:hypothetical protein
MGFLNKLRAYVGVMRGRNKDRPIEPVALLRKRPALMLGVNGFELAQLASALVGCPF